MILYALLHLSHLDILFLPNSFSQRVGIHAFFNALFNLVISTMFIGLELPTKTCMNADCRKKLERRLFQQKMNFDRQVEVCFKQESGTIKSSGLY